MAAHKANNGKNHPYLGRLLTVQTDASII